jgi:hypothetical protein
MRRLLVRLVPVALAAACSQKKLATPSPHDPAAREAILLTAHDLAPGRRCRIVDAEAPLPDVAAVLDTASMPEFLHQAGVSAASGYALFSIRFDSTGRPSRARLIDATIADSLSYGVQQSVASALLAQPAGAQHQMRLRVDFAERPAFRLGKSEYCEAEAIVHRGAGSATMLDAPGEHTVSRGMRTLDYEVEVSSAGDVLGIRFLSSLEPELEQAMRQSMMKAEWRPAIDDGLPVASRVSVSTPIKTRTVVRQVSPE